MGIHDAEPYVGRRVCVEYTDRHCDVHEIRGIFEALEHIPMYGTAIYIDGNEVPLDRVLVIRDDGKQAA